MREAVDSEFKAKEQEVERERNQTNFETTSRAAFGKDFTPTLRDSVSGLSSGKRRDPYYLNEPAITYYLHTALNSDNIPFPVSTIGSVNRVFAKGATVSYGNLHCMF